MLLKYKVYLIGTLYFSGFMFMILFPSRNYKQSGSKMREVRITGDDIKFTKYLDYKAVLEVANRIGLKDPAMANIVHLTPQTFANNTIVALELHSDIHSKKPGILIVGGIDGMAWGAPNAIMELAEKLLYDTNYQTPFFNDYDWYLIPMANPDAIGFTRALSHLPAVDASVWYHNTSIRTRTRPNYWHKNIEVDGHNACFGTNINRNFAYHWQDDVPKMPTLCSQYYPGAKPFSTAEARALRTYIDKLDDNIQMVIHLHASFAMKKEYILYPWRYTTRQPSNYKSLQAIGEYAARQARLPDGRLYQVHQASSDGRVAGTLSDYISGVLGIRLMFLLKPYHPPFANKTDINTLGICYEQFDDIVEKDYVPTFGDNYVLIGTKPTPMLLLPLIFHNLQLYLHHY